MEKKKKNKKIMLWSGLGIALLIILALALRSGSDNGIKVTVAPVTKATIIETVTANGKIQPALDIKISSDVSGEITSLLVAEGQQVQAGDLLVKIKPDLYQAALNRADASLNSSIAQTQNARARLTQVEAQFLNAGKVFKRQQELYNQKAISQSEYDNAVQQFEVAKAEVEAAKQSVLSGEYAIKSAQAGRREAADQLNRTLIYAPKSGTISNLNVEQGERVVGTAQMSGTEMMRISNMNEMEVHVDVNENDIIRVKLGDTALVEVDSYLNRKFKGIVTEIGNAAKSNAQQMSTDQVINFSVKISILKESYADLSTGKPESYSPFRPGMSASVEIQTQVAKDVIAVPIEAVTTRSDSTSGKAKYGSKARKNDKKGLENNPEFECVFIYDKGKARIRVVKTGIQDSRNIQVSGVKPGEEVITGPYSAVSRTLKNKTRVIKVEKDALYGNESEENDEIVVEEE